MKLKVILLTLLLLGLSTLTIYTIKVVPFIASKNRWSYIWLEAGAWVVFVAAVLILFRLKLNRKTVSLIIIAGAVFTGVAGLSGAPNTSDDSARYAWDGIVIKAGVSPYTYVPVDPHLAYLRPAWLFPAGRAETNGALKCPSLSPETTEVNTGKQICVDINRPQVKTIYPPVAEGLFTLGRLLVPASVGYLPLQILGLIAMLGTTLVLLKLTRLKRIKAEWVSLWAWCPLVVTQAVTNAHIDGSAVFFTVLATLLIVQQRRIAGGIVLGLAIATKFLPVLIAPPLLRRHPTKIVLAAIGTVAAAYLIPVAINGLGVLGYLPGYLNEEGYDNGSRSALLGLVVPAAYTTIVAAGVLAAVALIVYIRAVTDSPFLGQLIITGTALFLLSPKYSWYALLLVPFILLAQRPEWLVLPAVFMFRQSYADAKTFQLSLLIALITVVLCAAVRHIRKENSGWKTLLPYEKT